MCIDSFSNVNLVNFHPLINANQMLQNVPITTAETPLGGSSEARPCQEINLMQIETVPQIP